jgi:hypothetical protein
VISSSEAAPYRHIWVGVLSQAVRDIFRTAVSKYGCDELDHKAALSWIGSRDFHKVCALAGLDGTAVEAKLRRRLTEAAAGRFDPAAILQQRAGVRRPGGQHGPAARHERVA